MLRSKFRKRRGFSAGKKAFEKMVQGPYPRELKDQLENVAFMVEDEPSDL
jgi:hypothetical protein